MKLLMTGGTGFLGSHLLRKLLKLNYEVILLKRSFSNVERIEDLLTNPYLRCYNIDESSIETVFDREKWINCILHTATEYGRGNTTIHKILETNLILPVKLLELGIFYGVKSFINADSYFNKENTYYSNLLNYSLSKRSLLTWLKQLANKIQVINVVLEHMYGPYDSKDKFVEYLIQQIGVAEIERVSLTYGHQKRDFIYVSDVVDGYIVLLQYAQNHIFKYKTFELGMGKSMEIQEFANTISRLSDSGTELGFGDIPYRSDEIMDSKADNLALIELGWEPKVTVEEGVQKILDLYKSRMSYEK